MDWDAILSREDRINITEFRALEAVPRDDTLKILELINGKIVPKQSSIQTSVIAAKIGAHLGTFLDQHPLGKVTGANGGYILSDYDVFIPDAAYTSHTLIPEVVEWAMPMPPEIAVEVRSPGDRVRAMRRKAERYLDAGTKVVWLVFPDEGEIEVYTPDADVVVNRWGDTLNGGEVLPGFKLPIKNVLPAKPRTPTNEIVNENVAAVLTHIVKRPYMYMHPSMPAVISFLDGFNTALRMIGNVVMREGRGQEIRLRRGWRENSLGPLNQMREMNMTEEQIMNEFLAMELEYWSGE